MSAFTAVPALVKKSVQWTFDLVIDLGPTVVIDGAPAEMSEKVRPLSVAWWLPVCATIMIGL